MIMYELHVGTFSEEGTFAGAAKRASDLAEIGVNAVELMPVSQFSGSRNWGYDIAFPFAVQNTYGGPDELKKLVKEFHSKKIAVILDVVYNHFGPEGNFLNEYGPYSLPNRLTPWGASVNFDEKFSAQVRNYFIENALYWLEKYHFDGLRLDAVFAIIDRSSKHFLKELSEKVETLSESNSRKYVLIAENDRVEAKLLRRRSKGGYGLDAVWHDDFHHSIHSILTGDTNWYYSSFGDINGVVQSLRVNCVINTEATKELSKNLKQHCLNSSKLVVFSQNHDQIGNRPLGKRLIVLAGLEAAKLAAGLSLLSPFTPLLFMGEEYGEDSPFLFFTDYTDEQLKKEVFAGRKKELRQNGWKKNTRDPQEMSTFSDSKLHWQKRTSFVGKKVLAYYQKLILLRSECCKGDFDKKRSKFFVMKAKSLLIFQREFSAVAIIVIVNFSKSSQKYSFPCKGEGYVKILDSAETDWAGPGSFLPENTKQGEAHVICPFSIAVYEASRKKSYA